MKIFDWVIKDNVSPNENYYYSFKEPESLNPSAFGSEFALFDKFDKLIYHNKVAFAHELNDPAEVEKSRAIGQGKLLPDAQRITGPRIRLAAWSKSGNMIHILEYIRSERSYYHVFINLKESFQIRSIYAIGNNQEYMSIDAVTLTRLGIFRPNFNEDEVLNTLKDLGLLKKEPLIKDPVSSNFLADLLPKNKWYK